MSLKQYINEKNVWRVLRGKEKAFDINNLSAKDKKVLGDMIEGDLSPENLCCDGEAPMAYIRKRSAMLHQARAELSKIH